MASDITVGEMPETPEKPKKSIFIRLWPVYLIGAVFGLAYYMGWTDYLTFDALRENKAALNGFIESNFILAFVGFIVLYAVLTMFMLPASVVTITGGLLFGLYFGTAGTVVGATIGASALFLAAKTSFSDVLRGVAGPFLGKMQKGFDEDALSYMFALRLIPLFPFAVVNIAPALLNAKYRDYLITTFFGIIPGTAAYTWLGAGLGASFDAGENPDLATFGANLLPAFVALGVVALIPVAYKKIFKKSAAVAEGAAD